MTEGLPFDTDQKDWNMAVAFLKRLDRRLEEMQIATGEGDFITWFRKIGSIIRMIHWKIKQEGHEEQEEEMYEQLEKTKISIRNALSQYGDIRKLRFSNIEIELEKLEEHINDLIHEYNFLGFKKKKKDPGKAIQEIF